MNKLERSLLGFFIDFIDNQSESNSRTEFLVRKMIHNKKVQRTLIDCITKLEPILSDELAALRFNKPVTRSKAGMAESKLIVLSKDVKKLMKNFDSIKDKIFSVNSLVEEIDENLAQTINPEEENEADSGQTELVTFLRSMSKKGRFFDVEFEDIVSDTWGKHVEVEKMLKSEIQVYELRLRDLENKYLKKINQIKLKSGLKIQQLETHIEDLTHYFESRISKLQMSIEDRTSADLRKQYEDLHLMNEDSSFYFIPDIPTAVSKIKLLLSIRQILEKNRQKDEKIIQNLNQKIKLIASEFLESQEKLSKTLQNFSSVSLCLGKLISKSGIEEIDKTELIDYLSSMQISLIEQRFQDDLLVEFIAGKVYIQKARIFLYNPKNDPKDENFKEKFLKFLEETGYDTDPGSGKRSSGRNSGNQLKRTSLGKNKLKPVGNSPNFSPIKEPDSPINSMKKIMTGLDMELRSKNKQVNDDLSEIMSSFKGKMKDGKGLKVRTKMVDIQVARNLTMVDRETEADWDMVLMNCKGSLAKVLVEDRECATDVGMKDIEKYQEYYFNHDFIDLYQVFMKTRKEDKEVQTDKKIKFKEFDDSKLLIKGLMKKTALAFHSTIKNMKSKSPVASDAITNREATPKPPEGELYTERKDSAAPASPITEAQDLYQKEFAIYSQFLGYKKFDFTSLQKIWEEVINRRLIEGEKDKITSHLRTVFGTETYEEEKQKVIQLLTNINQDSTTSPDSSYSMLLKDFHKKVTSISRWRSFMISFIKSNISRLILPETCRNLAKLSLFLKVIRTPSSLSGPSQRSETVLVFKTQDWRVSSKSPVMPRKPLQKPGLSKQNKTFERLFRVKTPNKAAKEKLPSLNLFK